MSYERPPIDTSHVTLAEEMRQLTEQLAENAHEHWARQRLAEGWTYGPERNDAKKEHPCLVSYAALPESEKQYDRITAMETLKTVIALGYRLEIPRAHEASAARPAVSGEGTAMTDHLVDSILQQVNAPGANILALLEKYQAAEYMPYWQQDLQLYRAFGRALIKAGHPTRGFEIIRADLDSHKDDPTWKDDPELQYLRAWALARGGNASKATEYVEQLLKVPALAPPIDVDAPSLAGRLYKDRYERTTPPTLKVRYAAESAERYETAYQRRADSFPCINAATMALLAGQPEKARDLARRALAQVTAERQQPGKEHDPWLLATLGEAHLLLGDQTEAARWYRQAVRQAAGQIGNIASMRRQLRLLTEKMEMRTEILELFDIGHVVVFSGHMIDHPTRVTAGKLPPRFPPDAALVDSVSLAIREALDGLNATVGYSAAACGSDILFAEQMLDRQKELHIVLPFNEEDFYATSVDFGLAEMSQWRKRCDKVLAHATEVHYATTESFLGDAVLFEFVNTFTQGLAITRAAQLGVEPYALAVRDPAAPDLFGGTTYFVNKWKAGGYPIREVDLAALRSQPRQTPLAVWRNTVLPHKTIQVGTLERQVQAMLFSDVKNFSRLSED